VVNRGSWVNVGGGGEIGTVENSEKKHLGEKKKVGRRRRVG